MGLPFALAHVENELKFSSTHFLSRNRICFHMRQLASCCVVLRCKRASEPSLCLALHPHRRSDKMTAFSADSSSMILWISFRKTYENSREVSDKDIWIFRVKNLGCHTLEVQCKVIWIFMPIFIHYAWSQKSKETAIKTPKIVGSRKLKNSTMSQNDIKI